MSRGNTRKRFARIPEQIIRDKRLGIAELKTLAALWLHADKLGCCHPSRRTLAEVTGYDQTQVRKSTRKLEALGWITRTHTRGGHQSVQYQLHMTPTPEKSEGSISPPQGHNRGVNFTPPEGSISPPPIEQTIEQTSSSCSSAHEKSKNSAQEDRQPEWLPIEQWNDWLNHRESIGYPATPSIQRSAIRKLDDLRKAGHDPAAVLDHCIIHNWRGIFPPKQSSNSNISNDSGDRLNHRGIQQHEKSSRIGRKLSAVEQAQAAERRFEARARGQAREEDSKAVDALNGALRSSVDEQLRSSNRRTRESEPHGYDLAQRHLRLIR